MHLVESLAVALYQWPKPRLMQRNPPLYRAFISFEEGEKKHCALFLEGLSSQGEAPFFFTSALAIVVGVIAYLISFLLGFKALLYFEILIEYVAIWHYSKILNTELPELWQMKVREVQQDEYQHLQQMKEWLKKL
jgi:hypothetical protein